MKTNIKPIATLHVAPSLVSLSNSPNFVQLASNSDAPIATDLNKWKLTVKLYDNNKPYSDYLIEVSSSRFEDGLRIKSTDNPRNVNSTTFLVVKNNVSATAQNLKGCLCNNIFLKNSFHIVAYPKHESMIPHIVLASKTLLKDDEINITSSNVQLVSIQKEKVENSRVDTLIDGMIEPNRLHIELEIYNADNDSVSILPPWGTPIATLNKAYSNEPIWFDVNTLWANRAVYSSRFMHAEDWCDAGTCTQFRFAARRTDGYMSETFHISPTLYTVSGYDRLLEKNDMHKYTLINGASKPILPLATRHRLWHVKGQKQYFNFAMINVPSSWLLELEYTVYDTMGSFLSNNKVLKHKQTAGNMAVINTVQLAIDELLETHPQKDSIARVEVVLLCNGEKASLPMRLDILPESLYKVNDFAFLNSVGGWSSFNFGAKSQLEYKTSTETLYQTLTPDKRNVAGSAVETVFSKKVDEQFIVETMPLRRQMAEWLKEMSASPAVYELSTKRYVVVDELVIKTNSTDELFVVEMKFHYTDSNS